MWILMFNIKRTHAIQFHSIQSNGIICVCKCLYSFCTFLPVCDISTLNRTHCQLLASTHQGETQCFISIHYYTSMVSSAYTLRVFGSIRVCVRKEAGYCEHWTTDRQHRLNKHRGCLILHVPINPMHVKELTCLKCPSLLIILCWEQCSS